jgi:hypothetical protein
MKRQDELNEAWCKYMGKSSTEIMQALAFALRWCDEHPHWISVKDRKPKLKNKSDYFQYSEAVIVTDGEYCTSAHWTHSTLAGWYDWYNGDEELKGVTHWMPLPQAPHHIIDANKKVDRIIGTADHIKTALDVLNKKGGKE